MTALLTAFGPFADWAENTSEAAARLLERERPGLRVAILPVDHDAACAALDALLAAPASPILLTGLARGDALRLEVLARRPAHRDDGPAQARGLWPWAASLDAMRATGCPARLSQDAGRYVCETAYWRALTTAPRRPVAFLHVPPPGPEWPAPRVAAAVAACLDAVRA